MLIFKFIPFLCVFVGVHFFLIMYIVAAPLFTLCLKDFFTAVVSLAVLGCIVQGKMGLAGWTGRWFSKSFE